MGWLLRLKWLEHRRCSGGLGAIPVALLGLVLSPVLWRLGAVARALAAFAGAMVARGAGCQTLAVEVGRAEMAGGACLEARWVLKAAVLPARRCGAGGEETC